MLGHARLLDGDEAAVAERALREAIGLPRRSYDAVRGSSLEVTYIAVSAAARPRRT
jgi:hypothetical protein